MSYQKLHYNNHYIAYNQLIQPSKARGDVIFLSGFESDMNGTKALAIEEYAKNNNLNFIRFDYAGHGLSSGSFKDGTIGLWLENTLTIIDELTTNPQILVGSSMGGWLMMLAFLKRPMRIRGLVGIAAAPDFTQNLIWDSLTNRAKETLEKELQIQVPHSCGGYFVITKKLIEEARNHLLLKNKEIDIDCPVYLLQGMNDKEVPFDTAIQIATRLKTNDVSIKMIKDADHRISRPDDLQEIYYGIETILRKP